MGACACAGAMPLVPRLTFTSVENKLTFDNTWLSSSLASCHLSPQAPKPSQPISLIQSFLRLCLSLLSTRLANCNTFPTASTTSEISIIANPPLHNQSPPSLPLYIYICMHFSLGQALSPFVSIS
ncbi:hypothetical protein L6164_013974 [Bauhinia variegata]|uniref:Uncharacterized protein n=1 Tax=Bauhinia variegata TaxID=167791 RepID=A0ACB9NGE0_BAUVA|nr:hypothetical protein L6164_013974 [Bauhinia variegata]